MSSFNKKTVELVCKKSLAYAVVFFVFFSSNACRFMIKNYGILKRGEYPTHRYKLFFVSGGLSS